MKSGWLQYATLRAASLFAPRDQRAEWVREWQSELWYIDRQGAMRFCLGAFRDALWLRRNTVDLVTRAGIHLESPLSCLAFLATLAAVSFLVTVHLPGPASLLSVRDLPGACIVTLLFSCLFLPATLAVWRTPARRDSMPRQNRLRRGIFLALKIALVQPIMLCGIALELAMGRLGGIAAFGLWAACILGLRWIVTDQQRRCPVCLRLLTGPVRIGTPSRMFLEWYGAESTCSRGHGLLHTSETPASYSARPQWLSLGDSWSGL